MKGAKAGQNAPNANCTPDSTEQSRNALIKPNSALKGRAGLQSIMERKQEEEAGQSNLNNNFVRMVKLSSTSAACLD